MKILFFGKKILCIKLLAFELYCLLAKNQANNNPCLVETNNNESMKPCAPFHLTCSKNKLY